MAARKEAGFMVVGHLVFTKTYSSKSLAMHYKKHLSYERGMLDESGGVVTRTEELKPGGQVFSRGEWLTIIRINKSNGAVSSVTSACYLFLGYGGTMKLTPDRISDYKPPSEEAASAAKEAGKRSPIVNYPGDGFVEMTKAEWAKKHADYKSVRGMAENAEHGAYRFRRVMSNAYSLDYVFITDMKVVRIPQKCGQFFRR